MMQRASVVLSAKMTSKMRGPEHMVKREAKAKAKHAAKAKTQPGSQAKPVARAGGKATAVAVARPPAPIFEDASPHLFQMDDR